MCVLFAWQNTGHACCHCTSEDYVKNTDYNLFQEHKHAFNILSCLDVNKLGENILHVGVIKEDILVKWHCCCLR